MPMKPRLPPPHCAHIVDYYYHWAQRCFNVRDIAIHEICVNMLHSYFRWEVSREWCYVDAYSHKFGARKK